MSTGKYGEALKRVREAKGISLEEISAHTRIGLRFLEAIENEQLDQLPGGLFNRSFLSQYARYLGMEEDEIVQGYSRALESSRDVPIRERTGGMSPAKMAGSDSTSWPPHWALAAALAALIVAGVLYVGVRRREQRQSRAALAASAQVEPPKQASPPTPPVAAEPSEPAPTSLTAAVQAPTDGSAPASAPGVSGVAAGSSATGGQPAAQPETAGTTTASQPLPSATPSSGDGLVLQIAARKQVWLSITVDGEKEWQGTLQPSESRQVQAAASIRVTLGDAGGVAMTLNGRPLGAVGREGEVKTITLAARESPDPLP